MKILLDECVPWPIHRLLPGHECQTAMQCGWSGVKNGELLKRAEATFELFVTADQGILFQQNLRGRRIAILQLSTNKLRTIIANAAILQSAVSEISPGEFRVLELG